MGNTIHKWANPGPYPISNGSPTFDPMLGFPNGRKRREPTLTQQEMMAAKIPLDVRDYCAHHYLDILTCLRAHFPFVNRCEKFYHAYSHCEYEDYVLRLKEYERERRLLVRQQKRELAEKAAAA